jgi:acyl-coenzyme A thioesterase PaaI-like protein
MSPGSTVKTVEFKMSLLAGVQGDLLAIGEVVRKGRTLATCRLEVVEGNDRVVAIGLATYALQAV